jgi:hypothetical protein
MQHGLKNSVTPDSTNPVAKISCWNCKILIFMKYPSGELPGQALTYLQMISTVW